MAEFGSPKILDTTKQPGRKKVKILSVLLLKDWMLLLLNSVTRSSNVAETSNFCTCKLKLTAQNGGIYDPETLRCCGARSNFEGDVGVVVFVSVQTYDGVGHFDSNKLLYMNL